MMTLLNPECHSTEIRTARNGLKYHARDNDYDDRDNDYDDCTYNLSSCQKQSPTVDQHGTDDALQQYVTLTFWCLFTVPDVDSETLVYIADRSIGKVIGRGAKNIVDLRREVDDPAMILQFRGSFSFSEPNALYCCARVWTSTQATLRRLQAALERKLADTLNAELATAGLCTWCTATRSITNLEREWSNANYVNYARSHYNNGNDDHCNNDHYDNDHYEDLKYDHNDYHSDYHTDHHTDYHNDYHNDTKDYDNDYHNTYHDTSHNTYHSDHDYDKGPHREYYLVDMFGPDVPLVPLPVPRLPPALSSIQTWSTDTDFNDIEVDIDQDIEVDIDQDKSYAATADATLLCSHALDDIRDMLEDDCKEEDAEDYNEAHKVVPHDKRAYEVIPLAELLELLPSNEDLWSQP